MDASEVSEELQVNLDAVYRLIREGELESMKIASRSGVEPRKLRVPRQSVEAYIERMIERERAAR